MYIFDPDLFDFTTLNKYQGLVLISDSIEPSLKNDNEYINPGNANIENTNNNIPTPSNQKPEL